MNDDVAKLPMHQPQIVIERSIISATPVPNNENSPFTEPPQETGNFGGLIVTASGTSNASVIAPYTPTQEYVYIIPEFGLIPEVELQKQHLRKNSEVVIYLSENKQLACAFPSLCAT